MTAEPGERRTVVLLPPVPAGRARNPLRWLGAEGQLVPLPGALALVLAPRVPEQTLERVSTAFRRADLPVIEVRDGMLQARTARRGRLGEPVSAGLAAQSWPDQVLGLVFGTIDPLSLPGTVPLTPSARQPRGLLGRFFGRRAQEETP